jgi:LysR family transcriptional regulator, transcriptional activator for dmlA
VASKRLTALERHAGQRLINPHDPHALSATNEGLALLGHVDRVLEELAAPRSSMSMGAEAPYGLRGVCVRSSSAASIS